MIQNINAPHLKHSPIRRTFHEGKNNFQTHLQNNRTHMCCFHLLKDTAKIFQVLTAVGMKITVFWDTALCSLIKLEQCFRGAYCLHNHRTDDGYSKHLSNNNIFPGYQPCQLVKRRKNQRFEDHLCPRLQGTDVSGESVHVIYRPARVPRS
jgi:hypothetical protein